MPNSTTNLSVKITPVVQKDVETAEGILVYVTNAVLFLAAILPHGLSWTHAGLYLVILNSVHVFQRGLQKAVVAGKAVGITPIEPNLPPIPENSPPAPVPGVGDVGRPASP